MNWNTILVEPFQTVLEKAFLFVPKIIAVFVILLVGWIIASILKKIIFKGLKAIKSDDLIAKTGLTSILEKGQMHETFSSLVSKIIYWLIMLVVLVSAVNALGLTVTAELLDKLVVYIPQVVSALVIAVLGLFAGTFIGTIVTTASANAGISSAKALGEICKIVIIIFAVMTALEQLQIGTRIIEMVIFVTISAIGLAVAIAFGLGAKELAAKNLEDWLKRFKS